MTGRRFDREPQPGPSLEEWKRSVPIHHNEAWFESGAQLHCPATIVLGSEGWRYVEPDYSGRGTLTICGQYQGEVRPGTRALIQVRTRDARIRDDLPGTNRRCKRCQAPLAILVQSSQMTSSQVA